MKKLGFEDGKEDDLENQHKTLSAKVDNLSDKVNALTSRYVQSHGSIVCIPKYRPLKDMKIVLRSCRHPQKSPEIS